MVSMMVPRKIPRLNGPGVNSSPEKNRETIMMTRITYRLARPALKSAVEAAGPAKTNKPTRKAMNAVSSAAYVGVRVMGLRRER